MGEIEGGAGFPIDKKIGEYEFTCEKKLQEKKQEAMKNNDIQTVDEINEVLKRKF